MAKRKTSVCFFLPTGRTFTFHNAEIVADCPGEIRVNYTAVSDGKEKTVTFYKHNVAGVAICE